MASNLLLAFVRGSANAVLAGILVNAGIGVRHTREQLERLLEEKGIDRGQLTTAMDKVRKRFADWGLNIIVEHADGPLGNPKIIAYALVEKRRS